jgi:hypothetical protein
MDMQQGHGHAGHGHAAKAWACSMDMDMQQVSVCFALFWFVSLCFRQFVFFALLTFILGCLGLFRLHLVSVQDPKFKKKNFSRHNPKHNKTAWFFNMFLFKPKQKGSVLQDTQFLF